MSEKLIIKYFPENEFLKEPFQATEDAAGYDVFASEAKTILPKTVGCIRLDFQMAIPKGFYGKIFLRSGLFRCNLVTCNAGVIDADYRGSVEVLLINHHPHDIFTVSTVDRIAQIVFMKKHDVIFEKLSDPALLGKIKCGSGGFGSTVSSGNTIFVSNVNDQVSVERVAIAVNDKVIVNSDINDHSDKIIIDTDLSESNDDEIEEIE